MKQITIDIEGCGPFILELVSQGMAFTAVQQGDKLLITITGF